MCRFTVAMFFTLGLVLEANVGLGQDYPNKPIRIVTTAAGTGSDFNARQVAQGIASSLGQPVIVDNRSSTLLSAEIVLRVPPDGYTLLVNGGSLWIGQLLQKTPYDVTRDFAPISQLVREVSVVAVYPAVPAKSIKDLIALAKAKPGGLNYASTSVGGPPHLAAELFKSMANVHVVGVFYKGGPPAIAALIAGEVQLMFPSAGSVSAHVKAGRLRALAVTSAQPSALTPGLPTVAESGLPGYEVVSMTGIFAPAKTPAAIIKQLNQEIVRVLRQPEVKERFLNAGVEAVGNSPEEFAAVIKSDMTRMGKLIKDADIKVD